MTPHRFLVELYRDGQLLTQRPVPTESLDPALEWLQFEGVRQGVLPARLGGRSPAAAEPVWHPDDGEPFVEGIGFAGVEARVPTAYFREVAETASSELVERGDLKEGDPFTYRVLAFPGNETGQQQTDGDVGDVVEIPQELDAPEVALAELLDGAEQHGPAVEREMPVVIPHEVLDEVDACKLAAGGVETGGVLVGRLHRDRDTHELCLRVAAQIPARHAEAQAMRFTFTPETWGSVRDIIDLRGRDEIMVGWWHTHPAREWCKECAPERWLTCPLARSFFSAEDGRLHRMVFPRAYSVALVAGDHVRDDRSWESVLALYGWHQGLVQRRGYYVIQNA